MRGGAAQGACLQSHSQQMAQTGLVPSRDPAYSHHSQPHPPASATPRGQQTPGCGDGKPSRLSRAKEPGGCPTRWESAHCLRRFLNVVWDGLTHFCPFGGGDKVELRRRVVGGEGWRSLISRQFAHVGYSQGSHMTFQQCAKGP